MWDFLAGLWLGSALSGGNRGGGGGGCGCLMSMIALLVMCYMLACCVGLATYY